MKLYCKQNKQIVYQQAMAVLCLIFFVTTVWAGEPGAADAQKPPATHARKDLTPSTQIDTVTVTARKKEESVQKVPMSLSVFSGQMIEESGVNTTSELLRYSSNVYVRDAGVNHQTIIRGIN